MTGGGSSNPAPKINISELIASDMPPPPPQQAAADNKSSGPTTTTTSSVSSSLSGSIQADDRVVIYHNDNQVASGDDWHNKVDINIPNFKQDDQLEIIVTNDKWDSGLVGEWKWNNKTYSISPALFNDGSFEVNDVWGNNITVLKYPNSKWIWKGRQCDGCQARWKWKPPVN